MSFRRKKLIIEVAETKVNILEVGRGYKQGSKKVENVLLEEGTVIQGELNEESKFSELLLNWRKVNYGNRTPVAILLITSPNCILRDFTLPWINEKERSQAVFYQAEQEMPVPLAELDYQYKIESLEKERSLSVRFIAIKKTIVQKYKEGLSRAGFKILFIDLALPLIGRALNSHCNKEYLLSIQKIDDQLLNIVLFKNGFPSVAKYVTKDNNEMIKLYLSSILKDVNLSAIKVISDGTSQVQEFIRGLFSAKLNQIDLLVEMDFTLLSYLEKDAQILKLIKLQQKKIIGDRLYYALGFIFLLASIIIVSLYCSAKNTDIKILQNEIGDLHKVTEDLSRDGLYMISSEPADLTKENILLLLKTVETEAEGINIKRLNFKDKGLTIWAGSESDANIIALNNHLNLYGWQKPILTQYKYEQDKGIEFCLSVQKNRGNYDVGNTKMSASKNNKKAD